MTLETQLHLVYYQLLPPYLCKSGTSNSLSLITWSLVSLE